LIGFASGDVDRASGATALEQRWFAAVERVNQTEGLPKVEAFLEMNHFPPSKDILP